MQGIGSSLSWQPSQEVAMTLTSTGSHHGIHDLKGHNKENEDVELMSSDSSSSSSSDEWFLLHWVCMCVCVCVWVCVCVSVSVCVCICVCVCELGQSYWEVFCNMVWLNGYWSWQPSKTLSDNILQSGCFLLLFFCVCVVCAHVCLCVCCIHIRVCMCVYGVLVTVIAKDWTIHYYKG